MPATTLVLCAVGLAASGYLTYEHYTAGSTLSCPDTGAVNCLKVTTSAYSGIVGVPVVLPGLAFFAGAAALCLPVTWRSGSPLLAWLRVGLTLAGVGFVCYLVWAELFRVDAICLWCTVVHLVAVLLFFVVCLATALLGTPRGEPQAQR